MQKRIVNMSCEEKVKFWREIAQFWRARALAEKEKENED